MKTDARSLPDPIQWHEGMLLAPQHFQQMNKRQEALLHYHVSAAAPFYWGVRRLRFDPALLLEGRLRVVELEAVMPDGLVVYDRPENADRMEVDLTAPAKENRKGPVTVHLAVPRRRFDREDMKGNLARFDSVEGTPIPDENTGESEMSIPRLVPRLSLLATDAPPAKYAFFPIAKVNYENETYSLADYAPPALSVPLDSAAGELCRAIAARLREKALFLSERIRSDSAVMRGPMLMTTKSMIFSLSAALPQFEAVLNTGVSHPYTLYLALCHLVGQVASLGKSLVPPLFTPYDHNDMLASFRQAGSYISRMIDEGILETHTAVPFEFRAGVFALTLEESWVIREMTIGVKVGEGRSEKDILFWMEDSLIGSEPVIESLKKKRILGASRQRIEGDEDLIPLRGVVLFSIAADPEFILPNTVLQIVNISESKKRFRPSEIVLYVKNTGS